jgi:predicted phage terminase large subunit-like protein
MTTTPRPLPLVKALLKDEMTAVVRGSTYDNLHNLAPTFKRAVLAKYEGTTLGAQELHAVVLDDLPGALWKRADILYTDPEEELPEWRTVTVGLDPAGTGKGDETGLVVVARGVDGFDYVLEDASQKMSPNRAANSAYDTLERWGAKVIVVEDNGGKDWIETVLQQVWKARGNKSPAPIQRVNASQGKKLRAQPIAARYEQHRYRHAGEFHELEDQMCTWIPEEDKDSPDRIDALVHAGEHHRRLFDRGESAIAAPHRSGGMRGGTGAIHPLERARRARDAKARELERMKTPPDTFWNAEG